MRAHDRRCRPTLAQRARHRAAQTHDKQRTRTAMAPLVPPVAASAGCISGWLLGRTAASLGGAAGCRRATAAARFCAAAPRRVNAAVVRDALQPTGTPTARGTVLRAAARSVATSAGVWSHTCVCAPPCLPLACTMAAPRGDETDYPGKIPRTEADYAKARGADAPLGGRDVLTAAAQVHNLPTAEEYERAHRPYEPPKEKLPTMSENWACAPRRARPRSLARPLRAVLRALPPRCSTHRALRARGVARRFAAGRPLTWLPLVR